MIDTTRSLPKKAIANLATLSLFERLQEKYIRPSDTTFKTDLDTFPLSDSEKSLVVESLSYKYTSVLLQIGYLIRKSPEGKIQVPAHFIAGSNGNGAQCSEKTIYRFIKDTRDILIKCKDSYVRDEKGQWKRAAHKISLTKFGIELYTLLYTMFFGNCTRAVRQKGSWERTYQEMKRKIRKSYHRKKLALKDILMKNAYNFSEAINSVHKWYEGCFRWGKSKLAEVYEQLKEKNVRRQHKKMSEQERRNLGERKKNICLRRLYEEFIEKEKFDLRI